MRKLLSCGVLILMAIAAFYFVKAWRSTTPWGVGTGRIGGNSADLPARDRRSVPQKGKSKIAEISQNPTRYENKRMTVSGRVRGAGKLASNRNIYTLVDGNHGLLVIDDKKPPKEYWPRTVSGVVKVIGPPIGGLNYAYLVDVREGVKFNPPKWSEVARFFSQKYNQVSRDVKTEWNGR